MNYDMIASVVRDGLCTGCGTCIALCPKEAIKLTINEKKGIYVPELNEEKCNNCGICYKVCPGHEVDFKALNLEIFGEEPENILIGNYLNCYIGHATDYDIRYNSSSGGLVTQLLIFALEEGIIDGALVTKMKKDKPLEPEPFIARTKEELIEACTAKYCPVPANVMLKEILEAEEGEKFAVVGLPCHIHGIRKAEQINKKLEEKIVLHLGLFCSYGISYLATEYLLQRMNIQSENVTRINYREGDFPMGMMSIKLESDESKEISHTKFWGMVFSPVTWFSPVRCMLCRDQTCELADIAVGSGWFPYLAYGNVNQSLVLVRSNLAEKILQKCKSEEKIELVKNDEVKLIKLEEMEKYKISNLKARMSIFNLFGKKTPVYNMDGLSDPTLKVYLSGILLYTRTYFSSKRYLWSLMSICQLFLRKVLSIVRRK